MLQSVVARVAIDKASYSYDKLYTYLVPQEMIEKLQVGSRVTVPFGRGNKKRIALVMQLQECELLEEGIKPILGIIDTAPVITKEGITIADFLKHHTFCRYYDAVNCLLPAGMAINTFYRYSVCENADIKNEELSEDYVEIFDFIKQKKDGVLLSDLTKKFSGYNIGIILSVLESKRLIEKNEETKRKICDEFVVMIRLTDDFISSPQSYKTTKKQSEVLDFLAEVSCASLKEVVYYTGVTKAVTDNLVKSGVCEYFENENFRNPYENAKAVEGAEKITLTSEQTTVYSGLSDLLNSNKPQVALLHGITGSGKTLVYLKLAQDVIESGKSVIVMVPEISLTPQAVARFHSLFGQNVAVMHSGFTLAQRMDEWKRIKSGQAKVVVGTRSAVFAPLEDVGLIVIDEEQEHTYKSEASPRFSTHEVAKFRALNNNALLLLASATPSVESYYYAKSGKYSLFELNNRYSDAKLPEVFVVDMANSEKGSQSNTFSETLLTEINYNLEHGEQTILLLNRRGYNTSITCSKCGEPVLCPNCSVALTYHSANDMLMCHYCSHAQKVPTICPGCENELLRYNGIGTQRAEEELKVYFPNARILRMDLDTTMHRMSHEKYFKEFAEHKYDILIGTQMVSKGLDFEKVTLAGVMNVDQSLYANDFRAFERTFSLITQIVGRSGRGNLAGRAIIQTYLPDNPIIKMASNQDYKTFYADEIANRRTMVFPPFCDLCVISFSGLAELKTFETARKFSKNMMFAIKKRYRDLPLKVIGPVPSAIAKLNNKFRYKIVLKCKNNKRFRELISSVLADFQSEIANNEVSVVVDINPFNSI